METDCGSCNLLPDEVPKEEQVTRNADLQVVPPHCRDDLCRSVLWLDSPKVTGDPGNEILRSEMYCKIN